MKQSKLVQILKRLTKVELSVLDRHLKCLHVASSDNYRIFKALQKGILKSPDKLDLKSIKKTHFLDMSDKSFSNMLSRVNGIVEDWMVSYDVLQSAYEKELQLVRSYNQRGLYKQATQLYRKLEKRWTAESKLDLNHYKYLAQLYHLQYYSDNPIKYVEGGILLEKLVNASVNRFVEQGQFYQIEMVNWGRIKKYDYSALILLFEKLKSVISSTSISEAGASLFRALQDDDLPALELISASLIQGEFKAETELHSLIGFYCLNCARRLWRKGIISESDLISDLYDYCLETGILLQNGKIPRVRFFNIIGSLGTIRSYDYMTEFIERWISYVETSHTDSVFALAMAENCFIHQDYDRILSYVRDVTYEDIDSRSRAMCYTCVAMYEDKDFDDASLYTQIHNNRRFLRRHQDELSNAAYEGRFNFLTVLMLLSKRRYTSMDIDLKVYEHLHYRTWIKTHL